MLPSLVESHLRSQYRAWHPHIHPPAATAQELAATGHVSGYRVAKVVVVEVGNELAFAVVPAPTRLDLVALVRAAGAPVRMVPEPEFERRFRPCEPGAEPPFAMFGTTVFADERLLQERWILMPAGTHEDAIWVDPREWARREGVHVVPGLGRSGQEAEPDAAGPGALHRSAEDREHARLARSSPARTDAMLVRDAMTRGVETIDPDEPLIEAARHMKATAVGALAVCEGETVVGVVTDRDLVVRGMAEGRDPAVAVVRSAMTPQLVECDEDADLASAALRMKRNAVRRLLVRDAAGHLVGLLSVDDLAAHRPELAGEVVQAARGDDRGEGAGALWGWW